jgi:hypothetical protein
MRSRSVFMFAATLLSLAWVGGCSSDDSTASTSPDATAVSTNAASESEAPTVCAPAAVGDQPTVTIDVDDDSDGLGRFGLKTPSSLPAGMIRLAVNAVEDNPDPVDLSVTSAGASVFEFVQVSPGVVCGADVELAAGEYTVTFGAKTKTFTVDPAA